MMALALGVGEFGKAGAVCIVMGAGREIWLGSSRTICAGVTMVRFSAASVASVQRTYTISLAVKPGPPVEETNLMRRNFACTLATVRASPVVAIVVSIVWYSASTSAMAPCRTMFTAVGAVPKIVCQRTAVPLSDSPVKLGSANWLPAVLAAGNVSLLKLKPTSPEKREIGGVSSGRSASWLLLRRDFDQQPAASTRMHWSGHAARKSW